MLARRLKARRVTVVGRGVLRARRASGRMLRQMARSRAQAMVFTGLTLNGAAPLWRAVHRRMPRLMLIGSDGVADDAFTRQLIRRGSRVDRRLGRRAAERTLLTLYTRPADAWPAAGQVFADEFTAASAARLASTRSSATRRCESCSTASRKPTTARGSDGA